MTYSGHRFVVRALLFVGFVEFPSIIIIIITIKTNVNNVCIHSHRE